MEITLTNLSRTYGRQHALVEVSLRLGPGIWALLGPNGSGKTTLLRIVATVLAPSSGSVRIGTIDAVRDPAAARRLIGYLPQSFGFLPRLTVAETLDYIAAIKGIGPDVRIAQIAAALAAVNLEAVADRRVETLSGGTAQRVGIAQALLGNPPLLILDEPAAGLDPEERLRLRALLARLAACRTILLATHIVGDIAALATGVAILREGRLRFAGPPGALAAAARGRVWEVVVAAEELPALEAEAAVLSSAPHGAGLLARVLADAAPLGRGRPAEPGLEDGYVALLRQEAAYG